MAEWYVAHIRSGHEKKVKDFLGTLQEEFPENIKNILLPTEQIAAVVDGKKQIKSRFFMPGYLLLEIEGTEELWHRIQTTPGILSILGSGDKPTPLSSSEVTSITALIESRKIKPVPKFDFAKGDQVEIREGPFADFNGVVEEVSPEKEKLKVSISIFGRSTQVELNTWQVEKT